MTGNNIYRESRDRLGLTRSEAAETMDGITEKKIERIEYGDTIPSPYEVLEMSRAYKKPELCNHFCTHECDIGKIYYPEVKTAELPEITLGILSTLNSLNRNKDKFIDIAADGKISPEEIKDFTEIRKQLDDMSMLIDSLKIWIDKSLK